MFMLTSNIQVKGRVDLRRDLSHDIICDGFTKEKKAHFVSIVLIPVKRLTETALFVLLTYSALTVLC